MKYTPLGNRSINPLAPRVKQLSDLEQRKQRDEQRRKRNLASCAADRARHGGKDVPDILDGTKKKVVEKIKKQRHQYTVYEFVYDASGERYWHSEDLTNWSRDSINALIPLDKWTTKDVLRANGSKKTVPVRPSDAIARIEHNSVVECVTWWPGKPRIIHDVLVIDGADVPAPGRRMLNTYVAPRHHAEGDPEMAAPWVEHIHKLWPDDHELLLDFFAHTVQHPDVKINFGIVMIGAQGIGKDSALEPVRAAIGEKNCKEITPNDLLSNYNDWAACLLLVVNEARSTAEDFKATDFYEATKILCAAPPDWIRVNGKYEKHRYARNLMRMIITTNDPLALYVPDDDRRLHFVLSRLPAKWAEPGYFDQLHSYYAAGGFAHVYAYLRQRDVSKFDPKKKPASNQAFRAIVASWNSPVHDPLADVLDELDWPDVFFGSEFLLSTAASFDNRDEVVNLLKSSRKLAVRMNRLGYEAHRPEDGEQWRWREGDKFKDGFKARVAYAKKGFDGSRLRLEIEKRGKEIAKTGKAEPKSKPKPQLEVVK